MVKILSDNTVDIVIDVLENSNTFEKKHSTVYFGKDCWLNYTSDSSFIIHVEKGDIGLTIHASYNKTITVIANKPSTSDFWDRIDDCDHFMSTFYKTEEEHFMDSTVRELQIPFKLMKAVRDFISKYKKKQEYVMQFNGNVSKVALVFENCECVYIDVKDVLWMHIGDEKTLCSRFSNGLTISTGIGEFGIALRSNTPADFMDNTTLLERLKMRDVTHVYLYDNQDVERHYVVEWSDYNMNGQYSVNQRVQITPGGNIVFVSTTGKLINVDDKNIDLFTSYDSYNLR